MSIAERGQLVSEIGLSTNVEWALEE